MTALTKETFVTLPVPEQVSELARVDAKTRHNLILASRHSLDLVRSLSSEMLFYTMKEIGLADTVELLALASPEQVRDMVDLDCWRKDRLDDRRLLTWMLLLDEAGSSKLAEWFLHTDIELLVLLIKRHVEVVRKIDVEEDAAFDQSRYFTFDDQYLLRFRGEEQPILALTLERLRVLDYQAYSQVLENSLFELESSLEEAAFHWRNARMADRAYPDYDEAAALLRPVPLESFTLSRYRRAAIPPVRFASGEELIPSNHAVMLLDTQDSFFLRALGGVSPGVLEAAGRELAALTNQVVIADGCDPGEVSEVRRCVELVHDLVNIGLEFTAEDQDAATQSLQETVLRPFFQIGMTLVLRLHSRAQELDTALRRDQLADWLTYLDSPFREACAGALRRRPLFFVGLETPGEILARRFRSLAEVKKVETVLEQIPLWFAVLRRWEMLPERRVLEKVTLAVLWNTGFARWVVEQQTGLTALTREELRLLQRRLRGAKLQEQQQAFLSEARVRLQLSAKEQEALRVLATHAAGRLQEALTIDATTSDLRFVDGLLVSE